MAPARVSRAGSGGGSSEGWVGGRRAGPGRRSEPTAPPGTPAAAQDPAAAGEGGRLGPEDSSLAPGWWWGGSWPDPTLVAGEALLQPRGTRGSVLLPGRPRPWAVPYAGPSQHPAAASSSRSRHMRRGRSATRRWERGRAPRPSTRVPVALACQAPHAPPGSIAAATSTPSTKLLIYSCCC